MSITPGQAWIRSSAPEPLCLRAEAEALLSDSERNRAGALPRARRRMEFVAGRALLRLTLAEIGAAAPLAARVKREPNGQLRAWLGDRELAVSVSHTRGLVACGVGTVAALGVDVEALDRRVDALRMAERFFGPAEVAALARTPESERSQHFLALWTLKESLGKAQGRGVAPVLREPQFRWDPNRAVDPRVTADSGEGWSHELHPMASGHWLAVSALGASCIHTGEPGSGPGPS